MEVLFEYRGSRKELAVGSLGNLANVVTAELRQLGRTRAVVLTGDDTLPVTTDRRQSPPEVYLLQKWSPLWDCYVDVRHSNDVKDGDRLAVLARPKPPSKVSEKSWSIMGLFTTCFWVTTFPLVGAPNVLLRV